MVCEGEKNTIGTHGHFVSILAVFTLKWLTPCALMYSCVLYINVQLNIQRVIYCTCPGIELHVQA